MTRFAALGDSITVGMGDRAPGGGWRGWAALLAGTLPQPDLHNLAAIASSPAAFTRCWRRPGSRSAPALTPSRPARRRPGWPR
jgi:hypothetical protein